MSTDGLRQDLFQTIIKSTMCRYNFVTIEKIFQVPLRRSTLNTMTNKDKKKETKKRITTIKKIIKKVRK